MYYYKLKIIHLINLITLLNIVCALQANTDDVNIEIELKNCLPIQIYKPNSRNTVGSKLKYNLESRSIAFNLNEDTGEIILNPIEQFKAVNELKLSIKNQTQLIHVKINKLNLNCIKNETNQKIKLLLADSIFSYDFNDILNERIDEVSLNKEKTFLVALQESLMIDSFICYLLTKSNLNIEIVGNEKNMFRLDKVDSGSTSLLLPNKTGNAIAPVLNLYSLKLAQQLDREIDDSYELKFRLEGDQSPSFSSILNILITDINDNEPRFNQTQYEFSLFENNRKNYCIGYVKAIDRDLQKNGAVRYKFISNSLKAYTSENKDGLGVSVSENLFSLNQTTGEICALEMFDRECFLKYTFEIIAEDMGEPTRLESLPVRVEVRIKDLNDNRPLFYQQAILDSSCKKNKNETQIIDRQDSSQFYLIENSVPKTFVAWLKAYDLDQNENGAVDYNLEVFDNKTQKFKASSSLFSIDTNGIIRSEAVLVGNLNFKLKISVKDRGMNPLGNHIFASVKVVKKMEKDDFDVIINPDKDVFFVSIDNERVYAEPLLQISSQNKHHNYPANYTYQLVPLIKNSNEEYGKNCNQRDIINYFTIRRNGQVYISKNIQKGLVHEDYMICFVNIRVLSADQAFDFNLNVDLLFIVNRNDVIDEEKLLIEANGLKEQFFEAQNKKSIKLDLKVGLDRPGLNLKLIISLVFLILSLVLILFMLSFLIYVKNDKIKADFYRIFKQISTLFSNKNSNKNKIYKEDVLNGRNCKKNKQDTLLVCNHKNELSDSKKKNLINNEIMNQMHDQMLKSDSPSKENSSIDSNKCMISNSNNTTTTEVTPQKKENNNLVDCLNFFQQNFINSDLVELLDLTRNKQMNENAFIGFSTPNTEKKLNFNNSNPESSLSNDDCEFKQIKSNHQNKKVCYGVYQVSNQVLIDYDDNSSYEMVNSNTKHNASTNSIVASGYVQRKERNDFENDIEFENGPSTRVEPLQRFEEIYYDDMRFMPSYFVNKNDLIRSCSKNVSCGSFV